MQKIKNIILLLPIVALLAVCSTNKDLVLDSNNAAKTITFPAEDGLAITADLYKTGNANEPYIILFHQDGSSRGEYETIVPRLIENGYNCLAVDQRRGNKSRGVINQTTVEARLLGKGYINHIDALPDLRAALLYTKKELKAKKIILWGSSYSASLVFVLGSEFPDNINGILAFSPGEYFRIGDKKIIDYAKSIKCPVFFTAESMAKDAAKAIYDSTPLFDCNVFLDVKEHGSRLLWSEAEPAWEQVIKFLDSL